MGSSKAPPWWYWPLSWLALLWGLFACAAFFLLSPDPSAEATSFAAQLPAIWAPARYDVRSCYVIWAQLCVLGAVGLLIRRFFAVMVYFIACPALFYMGFVILITAPDVPVAAPLRMLGVFLLAFAVTAGWLALAAMAVLRGWIR